MKKPNKQSKSMGKKDLVASISEISGLPRDTSVQVLNAIMSFITKTLKDGNDLKISGFGTFKVHHRPASKGRNLRTLETIKIPAKKIPKFKASPQLKGEIA